MGRDLGFRISGNWEEEGKMLHMTLRVSLPT